MTREITDVPEATRARFPEMREKWRAIGLSTDPMNKEMAARHALEAYDVAGEPRPDLIMYAFSPPAGAMTAQWMTVFEGENSEYMRWVVTQFPGTIPYFLFKFILSGAPFGWREKFTEVNLDEQLPELAQILDGSYEPFRSYAIACGLPFADEDDFTAFVLDDQGNPHATDFYERFWNGVFKHTGRRSWAESYRTNYRTENMSFAEMLFNGYWEDARSNHMSNMAAGPHDAAWLGYYEMWLTDPDIAKAYPDVPPEVEPVRPHIEYAKYAGWWQPYDECLIIQDRPSEIHLNAENQLHNPNGYAVAYRDGSGLGMWGNIPIDADLLMNAPSRDRILTESNSEIMRILIERWVMTGIVNIINDDNGNLLPGVTLVHQDETGILYHMENIPNQRDGIHILHVVNGTPHIVDGVIVDKFYYIPLPVFNSLLAPDRWSQGPRFKTAREAVAFTYGMREHEYPVNIPRT